MASSQLERYDRHSIFDLQSVIILLMNGNLNSDDENPYDFIFNSDKQPPTPQAGNFGSGNRQKIIFVGFVAVVLMVVAIGFSVISSSGKDAGTEAISVQAYQNELTRVIELGRKNTGSGDLRKKISTLNLILITDQVITANVTSAKGVQATPVQLGQYRSSRRDNTLSNSLQIDNHDEVFEELIDDLVTDYFSSIKAAESVAKTSKERQSLARIKENIETIYNTGESPEQEDATEDSQQQTTSPGNGV